MASTREGSPGTQYAAAVDPHPDLTRAQVDRIRDWFSQVVVVADLSWGLTDTTVLHLRTDRGEVIVKAAGPDNHHIGREIAAREQWMGPWLDTCRVGRLLHADPEHHLLAVTYLPGRLVVGTPAAQEPQTHRQAGRLLAELHGQASRISDSYEADADARAVRWLDGEHRIPEQNETRLREVIAGHDRPPVTLVPTHGDWHPRNWLIDDGVVKVIDLGRADWRPALTDLARLARQEWEGRADLEAAFLDGYGSGPREPWAWHRTLLREAIGTAVWAYLVGDEPFEQQGHRMIDAALALVDAR